MNKITELEWIKKTLGPGILFASTAIGVSHLVQSTRAGASYGFGLLFFIIIANLFKYPFFEFASRYANSTETSIIDGYKKENIVIPSRPDWWPSWVPWVPDAWTPQCKDDYCHKMPCICYNGTNDDCLGNYAGAQNCNICDHNYEKVNVVVNNEVVSKRCVKIPEPSENVTICDNKSDCENIKLSIISRCCSPSDLIIDKSIPSNEVPLIKPRLYNLTFINYI